MLNLSLLFTEISILQDKKKDGKYTDEVKKLGKKTRFSRLSVHFVENFVHSILQEESLWIQENRRKLLMEY